MILAFAIGMNYMNMIQAMHTWLTIYLTTIRCKAQSRVNVMVCKQCTVFM